MRAKRKQKRMKIGITTVKGKISPKSSKKCWLNRKNGLKSE
jgi:hypothetical protein